MTPRSLLAAPLCLLLVLAGGPEQASPAEPPPGVVAMVNGDCASPLRGSARGFDRCLFMADSMAAGACVGLISAFAGPAVSHAPCRTRRRSKKGLRLDHAPFGPETATEARSTHQRSVVIHEVFHGLAPASSWLRQPSPGVPCASAAAISRAQASMCGQFRKSPIRWVASIEASTPGVPSRSRPPNVRWPRAPMGARAGAMCSVSGMSSSSAEWSSGPLLKSQTGRFGVR